jgi:type I restriction enzyme, S subunit
MMELSEAFWFQEGPGVRNWQFTNTGIKLLNVANITKSGDIDLSKTERCLSEEEVRRKYSHFLVDAGDLVIASSGISFEDDGLLRTRGAFIEQKHLPLCMNTSTIRFKAKPGISDLRYLKFWLDSNEFRSQITRLVTGSAQQNFGPSHLKETHITLPALGEQRRVASLLGRIDRLRRTRRYVQQISEHLLQTVFLSMFDKSLKNGDFVPLSDLVTISGGGTPARAVADYYCGNIPWVTPKDMRGRYVADAQEHITEQAVRDSATKLVPVDSILIVVKSKVLMHRLPVALAQRELCHNQDIKSLKCSPKIAPLFLLYVIKHNEANLLMQARGANTEGLTLPMLEEIKVPVIPTDRQQQFAEIVRRAERLRAQQREADRQAEHLFQTLLHRAFSEAEAKSPTAKVAAVL